MDFHAIPFGNYYLLERLAVGGMAEVYLAKCFGAAGYEKLVALKRILPTIAEDDEFIAMFIDEAKIAGQLSHANIAGIFDLGKINHSYFIAMEYVSGVDLRTLWDRANEGLELPLEMACWLTKKICEGLDYAHRRRDNRGRPLGIIHRDVSPQNVLVGYNGQLKIIDFGIAKATNRMVRTQTGILKGKFAYMAPEQARGELIDHRSDIFAIGTIFYELITGERAFKADSDFALLEKVRKVDVIPPRKHKPAVPKDLEKIIYKALAKDADGRYPWASALAQDIERFMADHAMSCDQKQVAAFLKANFHEELSEEIKRNEMYAAWSPEGHDDEEEEEDATTSRGGTRVQHSDDSSSILHELGTQLGDQVAEEDAASGEELATRDVRPKPVITDEKDFDERTLDSSALDGSRITMLESDSASEFSSSVTVPADSDRVPQEFRDALPWASSSSSHEVGPVARTEVGVSPVSSQEEQPTQVDDPRSLDSFEEDDEAANANTIIHVAESGESFVAEALVTSPNVRMLSSEPHPRSDSEEGDPATSDPRLNVKAIAGPPSSSSYPELANDVTGPVDETEGMDSQSSTSAHNLPVSSASGGRVDVSRIVAAVEPSEPSQPAPRPPMPDPRASHPPPAGAPNSYSSPRMNAVAPPTNQRKKLLIAASVSAVLGLTLGIIAVLLTSTPSPNTVIMTRPPGAVVSLRGEVLCKKTPCAVALKSGRHELVFTLAGVGATSQSVEIKDDGPNSVDVTMQITRTYTLQTDPPGARVTLDGKKLSQRTPVKLPPLKVGTEVRLVLERGRHTGINETVRVPDLRGPWTFKLAAATTRWSITTDPKDAILSVGSKRRVGKIDLDATVDDAVAVVVLRPGCETQTLGLVGSGRGKEKRLIRLKCGSLGGRLSVTALRRSDIVVDGVDIKQRTPLRDYPIPPGQHVVTLRRRGTSASFPVEVKPGEPFRLETKFK